MRQSPPLVPAFDVTVYLILDDFGDLGRAYRETDEEQADLETVIRDLLEGQYSNPQRASPSIQPKGWRGT